MPNPNKEVTLDLPNIHQALIAWAVQTRLISHDEASSRGVDIRWLLTVPANGEVPKVKSVTVTITPK